ncbi:MAG: UDP-N-acetylmuramoyl-L-alanyl-D-glutamate--2,6-diaminopimelate ligase [Chitinophagaceae bacterium]
MKTIQDILQHIKTIHQDGDLQCAVSNICIDSRKVAKGSLFVAIQGTQVDGHQYIEKAIEQGAVGIVCEQMPTNTQKNCCYIQVEDTTKCLGLLSANFYDKPSEKLKIIGITGTNGKTTCATLLYQLFTQLGYPCGLLSTVQNKIGTKTIEATHTTPDAVQLQSLLNQMYEEGCQYVFMEVSSHAIHQHRIQGIQFSGAAFTNITHDHLDYHQTFDEYIKVKKSFFDHLPPSAFAISNEDDKRGLIMLQNTKAKKKTYSLRTIADYRAKLIENNLSGLVLNIHNKDVFFSMIGEFNAYNLLCVFGIAMELHQQEDDVLTILSTLKGAEGRFDFCVSAKEQIVGIVDYAHTPDALLNVLATVNKLKNDTQQLLTVLGCGGNRDKAKRPLMARAACEHSNKVIFTSDNPRFEDPQCIINEMEEGVPVHQKKKYISILDRREAIKTSVSMSQQNDIILLVGKGHEKYQEINGVKNTFDDKKILNELFELFEK